MDIFITDKHSGKGFCINKNNIEDGGIIGYSLIDWCKQYLNKDSFFVDVGDVVPYSVILSSYCKQVYAFDENEENIKNLNMSCKINNITNVILSNKNLDDYDLQDVCFLKLNKIEGAVNTLKNNHYPPFIFTNNNNDFIKNLGYNIHNINGYPTMKLASDHKLFLEKELIRKNTNILSNYNNYCYAIKNNDLKLVAKEAILYNDALNGIKACETLSLSSNTEDKNYGLNAFYNYMPKIPYKNKIMLNCVMKPTRVPNNPSIIKIKNGYLCNIRCSNYVYEPYFRFLDGNIHLSDHMLITLSEKFMIKKTVELIDKTDNVYYPSFVQGVDDLRLIDEHRFICSHGNFTNHKTIKQCLGTFDENGHITKLIPLKGPNDYRHEKNWLPLVKNDGLYVVYMINPFILYKVNEETGDLTLIKNVKLLEGLDVKGSGTFIPYKNGLLATVHHTTKELYYMQRFIWMDNDFNTIKYSIPFYFQIKGTEFNLSICHSDEGLLITNSIRDNYSNVIVVDYNVVDAYLKL